MFSPWSSESERGKAALFGVTTPQNPISVQGMVGTQQLQQSTAQTGTEGRGKAENCTTVAVTSTIFYLSLCPISLLWFGVWHLKWHQPRGGSASSGRTSLVFPPLTQTPSLQHGSKFKYHSFLLVYQYYFYFHVPLVAGRGWVWAGSLFGTAISCLLVFWADRAPHVRFHVSPRVIREARGLGRHVNHSLATGSRRIQGINFLDTEFQASVLVSGCGVSSPQRKLILL